MYRLYLTHPATWELLDRRDQSNPSWE